MVTPSNVVLCWRGLGNVLDSNDACDWRPVPVWFGKRALVTPMLANVSVYQVALVKLL